ncbi:hypothetical protein M3231_01060 [Neobacillus mesonae]|nr:hypothetical protein [Neobacillus mesonae]
MIKPSYIEILKILYTKISKESITWALTGSTSFALQGLNFEPKDIDIQTDKNGAFEIQSLFEQYIKREVSFVTSNNIRSYFGELNINGVTIEIIGDIQKFADGEWDCVPDLSQITHNIGVSDMIIPVLTLEYEAEAYRKLGREEKAKIIAKYISEP